MLQCLYRGKFVRKYIKQCFNDFGTIASQIESSSQSANIECIRSLWSSTHENAELTNNRHSVSVKGDEDCITTEMYDLHKQSVPDFGEVFPVSLEELEDQLQLLKQEKGWLENAILARVEYLSNL